VIILAAPARLWLPIGTLMGFIWRISGVSLFLLAVGLVLVTLLIIESEPMLPGDAEMTAGDLQRARTFLANAATGDRLEPGEVSTFTVRAQEMELLLNYLLENLYGGSSRVLMREGSADLQLSAGLPVGWPGGWLNVQLQMAQRGDMLEVVGLQLGDLVIPRLVADWALQQLHAGLKAHVPEYSASLAAIRSYKVAGEELQVTFQWQPELFRQLSSRGRDLLMGEEASDLLLANVRMLAALTADPALPRTVPLTDLLGPMFEFAGEQQGDAVEANRAVMLAFFMYIAEVDPAMALGEVPGGVPELLPLRITLAGRQDFARHFLISAGLAVSAGTELADSVGLLKEVEDSSAGGSGFSFRDLAADRAGVRFAELAVAGQAQATGLQQMLASPLREEIFLPDFNDLPERLSEQEFQQAYGSLSSPAFTAVLAEIEARLARVPLFRQL